MDNPNTSYQLRVQSILPSINKKNEMKIYEFIEINRKEIIHMSVADAAEACGGRGAALGGSHSQICTEIRVQGIPGHENQHCPGRN